MTAEKELVLDIVAELRRARTLHPSPNLTTIALVEEVGELAKALLDEDADAVRKEAIQVACMAMRIVLDGDRSLDLHRERRALGGLAASSPAGGSAGGPK